MRAPLLEPLSAKIDPSVSDFVAIGIAGFLGVLVIALLWGFLPPLIRKFVGWLDKIIPADLSGFTKSASRSIAALLSAIVAASAALSISTSLGADTSRVLDVLGDFGKDVANTAVPSVLRIILILFFAWLAMRAIRHIVSPTLKRLLSMRADDQAQDAEVEKRARTLEGVIRASGNFVIASIAFLIVLGEIGINVAPLIAGAGIAGLAIAFGAQSLIRDVISGVFIMLEDQYRVSDVVRIGGVAGLVEDINLRRTTLRDLDFIVHVIPNGEVRIASNFTKEKSRVNLDIEVAYKEDLDHVTEVINAVGNELSQDPYFGPLITEPLHMLRVNEFGASGIAIKVLGETKPIHQWEVAGEFRKRIKRAFDEEGIEIPFPHVTMYWGTNEETRVSRVPEESLEGTPEKVARKSRGKP